MNELQTSKYKEQIGYYFNYSFDFDFLDIVAEILQNINFEVEDFIDDIWFEINRATIYTSNQWKIYKYYMSSPNDGDYDEAISFLVDDLIQLCEVIKNDSNISK